MLERPIRLDGSENQDGNRLRIAILMRNAGFLRHIQTEVRGLCDRGHAIHFAVQDFPVDDEHGQLAELCARYPSVSVGQALARRDPWAQFAGSLRGVLDSCRYLHPDFRGAIGLRDRAEDASPPALRIGRMARRLRIDRSAASASFLIRVLRSLYSAMPADPGILTYLRQLDLDLLITTGLVWQQSGQADYVLACRPLGIPTGYLVNSGNDLTNQGDVKAIPDEIYVCNDAQKREAVRLHGMSPKAVQVTGAPLFDRWSDRGPDPARAPVPDVVPFVLSTAIGSSSTANAVIAIERRARATVRRRHNFSLLWRPLLVAMRFGRDVSGR